MYFARSFLIISLLVMGGILLIGAAEPGCDGIDKDPVTVDFSQSEETPGFYGITGGTATNYATWKGAIALYVEMGGYGYICTGTFIDPQVILTAGHCVYYPSDGINLVGSNKAIYVLGGANIDTSAVIYYADTVANVVKHPNWYGDINGAYDGAVDLAMIKVNSTYTPVPEIYAVRSSAPAYHEQGVVVGYGNSTTGSGSGTHRMGNTMVQSTSYYGNNNYIELGDPSGTCQGDSGGPFFTEVGGEWVVTGVTSFGGETCYTTQDNWSVNVSQHFDWIDQQVMAWTGHHVGEGSVSDTDTDSDTDSDSDSDSDADTDADADADSDSDADADTGSGIDSAENHPFGAGAVESCSVTSVGSHVSTLSSLLGAIF